MLNEHDESAFPVQIGNTIDELRGMSLLDWFAAQCLSGLTSLGKNLEDKDSNGDWTQAQVVASQAYTIADAMMNERKRRYDEGK